MPKNNGCQYDDAKYKTTIASIKRIVLRRTGVSAAAFMCNTSRQPKQIEARQLFVLVAFDFCKVPKEVIARYMGRHHTTIIYAVNASRLRQAKCTAFAAKAHKIHASFLAYELPRIKVTPNKDLEKLLNFNDQ